MVSSLGEKIPRNSDISRTIVFASTTGWPEAAGPWPVLFSVAHRREKKKIPYLITKFTEVTLIGHPIPGHLNKQLKQNLAAQHLLNVFAGV